jgi:hypothetical protein
LIEALLVIRLHGISNVPRLTQVLDDIGRDLSRRSEGDSARDERDRGPLHPQDDGTNTPASQPKPRPARWWHHCVCSEVVGRHCLGDLLIANRFSALCSLWPVIDTSLLRQEPHLTQEHGLEPRMSMGLNPVTFSGHPFKPRAGLEPYTFEESSHPTVACRIMYFHEALNLSKLDRIHSHVYLN